MLRSAVAARLIAAALALLAAGTAAHADAGDAVAVRWWGQAFVTIETYWGLTLAIDPYALRIGYPDPAVSADLVCITHNHPDHNNPDIVRGSPHVAHALAQDGMPQPLHLALDRIPDQDRPLVTRADQRVARSPHALLVQSIPAFHDNERGAKRGRTGMILVTVDGLRILHCGDIGQNSLTAEQLDQIRPIDVLLIPVGGVYTVDGLGAAAITEQIRPRIVVPIHYKTEPLTVDIGRADGFLTALPDRYTRHRASGNTLGVAAAGEGYAGPTSDAPWVVVLSYVPWAMPPELAALFEKKEAASAATQELFRTLSIEQLNHKPSDGTHTPRWNAEHMAGTELYVSSAIYASLDPALTQLNRMPGQMPPDYTAAHPDWSGAEQARELQRVADYSRRFAYLLDGADLDALPPGAPDFFKSLRGYLERMATHIAEHTTNVRKKFDLPDWPR